jgi:hypothetical protein
MDNEIISIVIAGISLVLGIIGIRLSRQQNKIAEEQKAIAIQLAPKKEISINIISYRPLDNTDFNIANDIDEYYKENKKGEIVNLIVEVRNTGNQPIQIADYLNPIEFSVRGLFIKASQIMSNDNSIEFIKPITNAQASIRSETILLNQGDYVQISFFIIENGFSSARKSFTVMGRLVDGNLRIVNQEEYKLTKIQHKLFIKWRKNKKSFLVWMGRKYYFPAETIVNIISLLVLILFSFVCYLLYLLIVSN